MSTKGRVVCPENHCFVHREYNDLLALDNVFESLPSLCDTAAGLCSQKGFKRVVYSNSLW